MVDTFGRWTEEKDYTNYPEEKMCNYDHMDIWIREQGYEPKTSMEHLIDMIFLIFDCSDNFGEYDTNTGFGGYGEEFTLEGCKEFIRDSGSLAEFDFYS